MQSLLLAATLAVATPKTAPDTSRLVVLGGPLTEIVFALGLGDRVVGVDKSSLYPPAATELPQVGYFRHFSSEGVLSLEPSVVLALDAAGPPPALAQLRATGVPVLTFPEDASLDAARKRILAVGEALGVREEAEALVANVDAKMKTRPKLESSPKVMFIYARGGGTLNVSGTDTAAAEMIALAGGTNAVTAFSGFKPLTAEAVVTAAPEVILVTEHGLKSLGGEKGLWALPGLSLTPAGKKGRVVAMPDLLLLGFGPRLGEAVHRLAGAL